MKPYSEYSALRRELPVSLVHALSRTLSPASVIEPGKIQ